MTYTKGNIIVEEIEVGDIHYEYQYNLGKKSQVLTKPQINENGNWEWESKNVNSGEKFYYLLNPDCPPHYSLNLYDYQAYEVKYYI